ncbi:MAG: SDR family NAD(P)-dependent oxidoreductase [Pseudomonadota bacterium]
MKRFEGKVAIVTGAGTGIGAATCGRLADEGATVIGCVENQSQLGNVSSFDGRVLDVTVEDDWQAAVTHAKEQHGGLDVLVNNAGMIAAGNVEETTDEQWARVLDVNLTGMFRGCRAATPLLRARGGGAVVNLASINSIRGNHRTVAYSASKGGVLAFTCAMALDLTPDNIRVNCVCPGSIQTAMIEALFSSSDNPDALREAVVAKHPIGRLAEPREVAALIAFLASDDASFMTGMAIPVDGGRSIR